LEIDPPVNNRPLTGLAGLITCSMVPQHQKALKEFLETKAAFYNEPGFVSTDPISIPHMFTIKEDMEISALLVASIAWGNRKSIQNSGRRLVELMDLRPAAFIQGFTERDLIPFKGFVHRTFNEFDLLCFFYSLRNIYQNHGGLEAVFREGGGPSRDLKKALIHFYNVFFEVPHLNRSRKHLGNPAEGSAAKRTNMFLRWMVRRDDCGVDLGLWSAFRPSDLFCPLDVHSGRVARQIGLLTRKQNDWKAVEELTANLRKLDPVDPVKYDFALFGMGVFEKQATGRPPLP
jgi:uncharacterized protein (TIGR02757 family)